MSNKFLLFSKLLVIYTWQWTLVDELWTVLHRDGIPVRRWRTAWRTACQAAGVPTRFLHDCRRTAARNLIRANVPERGRHAPDRAQEPSHLRPLQHHPPSIMVLRIPMVSHNVHVKYFIKKR